MGVARADAWLLPPDDDTESQLAERRRLLAERRDDVLIVPPSATTAWKAVLEGMARAQGAPMPRESLVVVGQDDVCLLQRDSDGIWRLTAGLVCFPSHWRLADKVGRPVGEVHGPVPGYAAELGTKVDTFIERLRLGASATRRNWMLHERPDLFAPDTPPLGDTPADDWWLRSERQGLHRLSDDVVVFTIRTQQVGVQALRDRPVLAATLAARLRDEPDDLSAYRIDPRARAPLVAALARIADEAS